jgi:hypothetical protein
MREDLSLILKLRVKSRPDPLIYHNVNQIQTSFVESFAVVASIRWLLTVLGDTPNASAAFVAVSRYLRAEIPRGTFPSNSSEKPPGSFSY